MASLVLAVFQWEKHLDKDVINMINFFSIHTVLCLKTINAGFVPLQSCNAYIASGPKSSNIELKHSMCCGVREVCFALLYTSISWLKKKDSDSNPFCEL